jgi:hypothetical protein
MLVLAFFLFSVTDLLLSLGSSPFRFWWLLLLSMIQQSDDDDSSHSYSECATLPTYLAGNF